MRCWRCCSRDWKRRASADPRTDASPTAAAYGRLSASLQPASRLLFDIHQDTRRARGAMMDAEEQRAAGDLCRYPCQPAGVQRVPRCRARARRGADRLPRRYRRLWRRSGMGGRYRDGPRRGRRHRRARQPRQRHRHAVGKHERRGPGRDRMDARQAQRAAAAFSRRTAADAAGGRSPLRAFRSHRSPRAGAMSATRRTPRAASRRPTPMSPSAATSTGRRSIRCRRRRR